MKNKQQASKKPKNNVQLAFEASPEMAQRLRERAQEEGRSLANYLRRCMQAALEHEAEKTAEALEVEP